MYLNQLHNQLFILIFSVFLSVSTLAADKRIGVVVFDGVLTSDITAPLEVFGVASKKSWFSDYDVITINTEKQALVITEEGLTIQVDDYLVNLPKVDVLLIPSSYDMAPIIKNKALISYINETSKTADWLASNCSGAFVLAEAGVLDGKRATTWAGGEAEFKSAYPAVDVQFDQNYVVDGNVITSNGSVVSYDAALVLLEKMSSKVHATEVKETLQAQRLW